MRVSADDAELLRRAMGRLESATEIMHFVSDYCRDKYGLTPENRITRDGEILGPEPPKLLHLNGQAMPIEELNA